MIQVKDTTLDGVKVITLPSFEDFRGEYVETWNEEYYKVLGDIHFIQDDISVSTRNVLRGIHGDSKTYKLISCLYGKFYLVVVNCDTTSPEFRKWEGFTLSNTNRLQVLVPPKHGNAHLVLSDKAIFHYKQNTYYDRASQFTYKWNDKMFDIWWPISNPILSKRDG